MDGSDGTVNGEEGRGGRGGQGWTWYSGTMRMNSVDRSAGRCLLGRQEDFLV